MNLRSKLIFPSLTLFLSFLTFSASAQAPLQIPYQGVARDAQGAALQNQSITLLLAIEDNTGTELFSETHSTTTNQFGLFTVKIGSVSTLPSNLWSNGDRFLHVKMDPTGGSVFTDLGTTQFLSVPYALYAETSNNPGPQGPAGPTGANGIDGTNGQDGAQGPQGIQGIQGEVGPQGPEGADGAENAWSLLGNDISSDNSQFIGTISNNDVVFKANSIERMRISSNGGLGIGGDAGTNKLNVHNGSINITDGIANYSLFIDNGSIFGPNIFNKNTYGGGFIQAPLHGNIGIRLSPNHWDDGVFILSDKNLDGTTDFSALSVLANGWVGIGKNKPSQLFQISDELSGIDSSLFFGNSGKLGVGAFDNSSTLSLLSQATGSFLSIYDQENFKRAGFDIEGDSSVQYTNFQFNLYPKSSSEQAQFRFFRKTNTSGQKNVIFFRGNNTTQASANIGVDGANSYFNVHGGNLGIGTATPARTLHVNAVMRLEPISTSPSNPSKGDMYFDSTLNKLRVFDGTIWQNCW